MIEVERVYDDFWTQTPLGLLEFSDEPMHAVPPEDQYHGFFRAQHVALYLEKYCVSRMYDGASLRSRIQTNEPVAKVRKDGELWHVSTKSGKAFTVPQVVDASGLTSIPNYPQLLARESFKGTIIHHKDFAGWEHQLKESKKKDIIVIGGAKSAADVAYGCAKAGQNVTWLIRRSGSGPAAFVSAKGRMGYANSNESFYTRLTSLFLVSLFALSSGYQGLQSVLNRTALGRRILQRTWQRINAKAWKEADYDRADGRANGFRNLKPDTEIFWQNDSTGINQRQDFFDTIAKHVKVVRKDLSRLCEEGLVLNDGEVLKAGVIVCATGWKAEHPYLEKDLAAELGLPVARKYLSPEQQARFDGLDETADREVAISFPILDSDWARSSTKAQTDGGSGSTAFRLWKSIVPVEDQSILFVGKLMLGNHFRAAEVQALFACAVLDGTVDVPSIEQMQRDISRTVAWCRRRYLQKGELGSWVYWDMVPYTDMLLRTMGLHSHRHSSWWNDLVKPCYAKDLAGLIDEYRNKFDELKQG